MAGSGIIPVQIKEIPTFAKSKNTNLLPNLMATQHIGCRIHVLESVDSSNNYAMARLRSGEAAHGEVFFALEQTAGKGQMGRKWTTRAGENIITSIVLDTRTLSAGAAFPLSMAVALACYDFFSRYAGEETSIKWPNDIYWRDRKAGGILIENSWNGPNWQFAIAGIGININQVVFDSGIKRPVSLRQITGNESDLMELLKNLCHCIETRWDEIIAGKHDKIQADYNSVLFGRGKKMRLRKGNVVFESIIEGVDLNGQLLTSGTVPAKYSIGEIEWEF